MSSILNDVGHFLNHATGELSKYTDPLGHAIFEKTLPLQKTVLPIVGGIAGGFYGGPWGAAAGSAIGTGLAGGNNQQILTSGLTGYIGGEASGAGSTWGSGIGAAGNAAGGAAGGAAGMGGGSGLLAGGGSTGLSAGAAGAGDAGAGSSLADLTSLSGGATGSAAGMGLGSGLSAGAAGAGEAGIGAAAASSPSIWQSLLSNVSSQFASPRATTIIPALTTAYNSYQQEQQAKQMAQIAQQSNAFGPYRQQYANQLNQLMANPSQIQNTPGYQAALEAISRQMGARGQLGSGMEAAALGQVGGQLFQQQFNNLESLSGANINPAIAANALAQSQQMQSQATGQMGSALTSLFQ